MIYNSNIRAFVDIVILQHDFIIMADNGRNMLYLVDLTTNSTCHNMHRSRQISLRKCFILSSQSTNEFAATARRYTCRRNMGLIVSWKVTNFRMGLRIPTTQKLSYPYTLLEDKALHYQCHLSVMTSLW